MKRILVVVSVIASTILFAETAEEAYVRLSSYRSLWDTNAMAYAKRVAIGNDPAVAEAKTRWFLDVLAFPDVTETNRLGDVLWAKEKILIWNAGSASIIGNTNCWYAVADFIARLKAASDPRWIDERYKVITGYMEDGVAICANTNPLLDFASYKLEHYEEYKRQHTNLVTEADVLNSFYGEWSDGISERQRRERRLARAQDFAKQRIKMDFWLFGAKDFPAEVKAVCRSNIVERAHLTAEEERDIFEDVPYWYYRVMGIKQKKEAAQ